MSQIAVSTIDSSHGSTWEVVFFSLVNDKRLGFMTVAERLAFGATRALGCLVILSSWHEKHWMDRENKERYIYNLLDVARREEVYQTFTPGMKQDSSESPTT